MRANEKQKVSIVNFDFMVTLKMSSFVFCRRKKVIQVWKDIRVSK